MYYVLYVIDLIIRKENLYIYIYSQKKRKEELMKYTTNYSVATQWLNPSLILCNNISEVDTFLDYRFDFYNEEEGTYIDIYQHYLTSLSASDVEYLEEHFGLLFAYSEMLDLYVLCVDHYGTAWDYVSCGTDIEQAQRELGESK